ncbi:extracellular solute-binding protein [Paenibacillus sp. CC-CFT747]|nr:extracellular solute-binding protein [Paenibacillus sp. CC-CFT747]
MGRSSGKGRSKAWFLSAVSLAVMLSACSSGTPKDKEVAVADTAAPKKAAKIVALSYNPSYDRKGSPEEKHVHDLIQEKTGADVEVIFTPSDQFASKRNLMLSSDEQLDFAEVSVSDAIDLYKNNAIIAVDDLLNTYGPNLKKNVKPQAFKQVTFQGKILGIPREAPVITPDALQIRKDWLKNLGLSVPKSIEDFEKVMDAFKNGDPDRNGKNDTYPLTTGWGNFGKLETIFSPNFLPQAMAWWKDSDGKLKPAELHPGYSAMMAKFVEWNKKGYIWPDMLLSNMAKQQEVIAQNKAGTVAGWFSSTIVNAHDVLRKTVPDAEYQPIMLEGKGINKLETTSYAGTVMVIFKKSKHPEEAMKLFNFEGTYDGWLLGTYGVAGENYNMLPDGMIEFISDDKTDINKAKYYAKYSWVGIVWDGKPAWPIKTWVGEQYNLKKQQVESLPRFDSIDKTVFYDQTKWKSSSRLNDMKTYLDEQKVKVFTGEVPVSDWEKIMKKWLEMGASK